MGSTVLRLLTAALVGFGISLVGWAQETPAPAGIDPMVWGLIGFILKFGVDWLTAKFGPARPADPSAPLNAKRNI